MTKYFSLYCILLYFSNFLRFLDTEEYVKSNVNNYIHIWMHICIIIHLQVLGIPWIVQQAIARPQKGKKKKIPI